ncbi:hypothetical protein CYLTODRAFT_447560 [Cylindrobasidium torrendii FP15055 ss-10]|uniref:Zn(2)-C6 fungal-type domain-containing protein n=1 Tax=Cylindrobasidium torrendii FP15055 ss-10 TaxID=1314674 RepID=A0A0D7ATS5_9AGAR|nr:hypothetical protein CYLTODRAFT_447560 [Cylindrobasidium torrendii FP15055 ss-10]
MSSPSRAKKDTTRKDATPSAVHAPKPGRQSQGGGGGVGEELFGEREDDIELHKAYDLALELFPDARKKLQEGCPGWMPVELADGVRKVGESDGEFAKRQRIEAKERAKWMRDQDAWLASLGKVADYLRAAKMTVATRELEAKLVMGKKPKPVGSAVSKPSWGHVGGVGSEEVVRKKTKGKHGVPEVQLMGSGGKKTGPVDGKAKGKAKSVSTVPSHREPDVELKDGDVKILGVGQGEPRGRAGPSKRGRSDSVGEDERGAKRQHRGMGGKRDASMVNAVVGGKDTSNEREDVGLDKSGGVQRAKDAGDVEAVVKVEVDACVQCAKAGVLCYREGGGACQRCERTSEICSFLQRHDADEKPFVGLAETLGGILAMAQLFVYTDGVRHGEFKDTAAYREAKARLGDVFADPDVEVAGVDGGVGKGETEEEKESVGGVEGKQEGVVGGAEEQAMDDGDNATGEDELLSAEVPRGGMGEEEANVEGIRVDGGVKRRRELPRIDDGHEWLPQTMMTDTTSDNESSGPTSGSSPDRSVSPGNEGAHVEDLGLDREGAVQSDVPMEGGAAPSPSDEHEGDVGLGSEVLERYEKRLEWLKMRERRARLDAKVLEGEVAGADIMADWYLRAANAYRDERRAAVYMAAVRDGFLEKDAMYEWMRDQFEGVLNEGANGHGEGPGSDGDGSGEESVVWVGYVCRVSCRYSCAKIFWRWTNRESDARRGAMTPGKTASKGAIAGSIAGSKRVRSASFSAEGRDGKRLAVAGALGTAVDEEKGTKGKGKQKTRVQADDVDDGVAGSASGAVEADGFTVLEDACENCVSLGEDGVRCSFCEPEVDDGFDSYMKVANDIRNEFRLSVFMEGVRLKEYEDDAVFASWMADFRNGVMRRMGLPPDSEGPGKKSRKQGSKASHRSLGGPSGSARRRDGKGQFMKKADPQDDGVGGGGDK